MTAAGVSAAGVSADDVKAGGFPRSAGRERLLHALVGWLPRGRLLPEALWHQRHRQITRFALLQAAALGVFAAVRGFAVVLCIADVAIVATPALFACAPHASRRLRTAATTTSLMFASAVFVDLAGGVTEAHFHFFVMVGIVALYQDWTAFGLCIAITVLHHAVLGSLAPRDVYGSPAERHKPILWACIHGAFVLAASVTHLIAWRHNEDQELLDSLTSLPNRAALRERLRDRLAKGDVPFNVLFIDLDNFKRINDSAGHLVGDHALQAATGRIAANLRQGDFLARLGGDEFAVLLPGNETTGINVAFRIAEALQPPIQVDGREIFVRASMGVVGSESLAESTPDELLRSADVAMYLAKSSGKNQVAVYDTEVDRAVRERAQLTADLRRAVATDITQFDVHYQPVVRNPSGELASVEALARWNHPDRGLIPPADFIPLAEDSGDIRTLGTWILHRAATQVVAWQGQLPDCAHLGVAVNVSPRQLEDDSIVDIVLDILEVTGLQASCLTLEVTETTILHDREATSARLNRLRQAGVKVAIDDFGTGYSSLSYLKELPADIVKIDRSFVETLRPHTDGAVLVQTIIDMARNLHLEVVAEGVELAEQQELLTELGCGFSQGYLHSRPLRADAFASLPMATGIGV